mmetsp:Transcript_26331/g.64174  ORF Transcript_26331/g.64174 Transcript_26331/m.64174 type:complete len:149 (-) Transcript_26331:565-1011(-)
MEMRHGVFARTNFWRAPNLSSPTKPHFHNLNPKMEKLLIEGAIKETGYAANSISIFLLPSIFPSMRQPEIFGFFGLFFFDLQMTADAHQQFQNKWVWDGHTKSPKQQLTNILDLDRFCWHMVMFCGVPTCNNSLSHPSPRRICQKQKN